jgi:hypothetical protein
VHCLFPCYSRICTVLAWAEAFPPIGDVIVQPQVVVATDLTEKWKGRCQRRNSQERRRLILTSIGLTMGLLHQ